jgi:hypothetical protein
MFDVNRKEFEVASNESRGPAVPGSFLFLCLPATSHHMVNVLDKEKLTIAC